MLKTMKNHMSSHRGDANVSKMTLVAIVFVVGAILLVLTTSAFRGPINRWFDKVQASWFADENGMFEADNQFLGYEKNANGTYKGVQYRKYYDDGHYDVLYGFENLQNGAVDDFVLASQRYDASGKQIPWEYCDYFATDIQFSEDGTAIMLPGETFYATIP